MLNSQFNTPPRRGVFLPAEQRNERQRKPDDCIKMNIFINRRRFRLLRGGKAKQRNERQRKPDDCIKMNIFINRRRFRLLRGGKAEQRQERKRQSDKYTTMNIVVIWRRCRLLRNAAFRRATCEQSANFSLWKGGNLNSVKLCK